MEEEGDEQKKKDFINNTEKDVCLLNIYFLSKWGF